MRGVRVGEGERRGEAEEVPRMCARVVLRSTAPNAGLEAAQADLLYCQKEEEEGEDVSYNLSRCNVAYNLTAMTAIWILSTRTTPTERAAVRQYVHLLLPISTRHVTT